MILDLARQGLFVSAIARRTGHDRKTVRKYLERGMQAPAYKPREPAPSPLSPVYDHLRERVARFPDLTGRRLWREIRELDFTAGDATGTDGDSANVILVAAGHNLRPLRAWLAWLLALLLSFGAPSPQTAAPSPSLSAPA